MSKNLLGSARNIQARIKIALVREDRAGNDANYSEYTSLLLLKYIIDLWNQGDYNSLIKLSRRSSRVLKKSSLSAVYPQTVKQRKSHPNDPAKTATNLLQRLIVLSTFLTFLLPRMKRQIHSLFVYHAEALTLRFTLEHWHQKKAVFTGSVNIFEETFSTHH